MTRIKNLPLSMLKNSLLRRIAAALLLVGLVGCASAPRYAEERKLGQACIAADSSRANASFTPTQGVVTIMEVDGVPLTADSPVCVEPGRHKFKVNAWTDFRKTEEIIELDLSPNLSYWLRGKLNDGSFSYLFDFQLIDVTADRRNVVAEFSIKAVAMSYDFIFVPGRTPLIIPVAR